MQPRTSLEESQRSSRDIFPEISRHTVYPRSRAHTYLEFLALRRSFVSTSRARATTGHLSNTTSKALPGKIQSPIFFFLFFYLSIPD